MSDTSIHAVQFLQWPDGARLAIENLQRQLAERDAALARCVELQAELENIANAKPETWEDPSDFKAWAQSRARHTLVKASLPASAQAMAKVLAAARRLCDCDVLAQDLWDDLREAIREEQETK